MAEQEKNTLTFKYLQGYSKQEAAQESKNNKGLVIFLKDAQSIYFDGKEFGSAGGGSVDLTRIYEHIIGANIASGQLDYELNNLYINIEKLEEEPFKTLVDALNDLDERMKASVVEEYAQASIEPSERNDDSSELHIFGIAQGDADEEGKNTAKIYSNGKDSDKSLTINIAGQYKAEDDEDPEGEKHNWIATEKYVRQTVEDGLVWSVFEREPEPETDTEA